MKKKKNVKPMLKNKNKIIYVAKMSKNGKTKRVLSESRKHETSF